MEYYRKLEEVIKEVEERELFAVPLSDDRWTVHDGRNLTLWDGYAGTEKEALAYARETLVNMAMKFV